jgi:hypothetical protein
MVGEHHAFTCHAVDLRSQNVLLSLVAYIAISQIIGQDKDDVGFRFTPPDLGGEWRYQEGEYKYDTIHRWHKSIEATEKTKSGSADQMTQFKIFSISTTESCFPNHNIRSRLSA